jgi:hypothetical protein
MEQSTVVVRLRSLQAGAGKNQHESRVSPVAHTRLGGSNDQGVKRGGNPATPGANHETRRNAKLPSVPLDPIARDIVRWTKRALRRGGYDTHQLDTVWKSHASNSPRSQGRAQQGTQPNLHDPAHALTLWSADPDYVDDQGRPKAVPARGPGATIESLFKRVDPDLSVKVGLKQLISTGTIRRVGREYIPVEKIVTHTGQASLSAHQLLALHRLLRNLEGNSRLPEGGHRWFEQVSECPNFPAGRLADYLLGARERTIKFLQVEDDEMARTAFKARSSARRVRPTINVFFSVGKSAKARQGSPTDARSPSRQQNAGASRPLDRRRHNESSRVKR